jgi:hypothetical protein
MIATIVSQGKRTYLDPVKREPAMHGQNTLLTDLGYGETVLAAIQGFINFTDLTSHLPCPPVKSQQLVEILLSMRKPLLQGRYCLFIRSTCCRLW